MDRQTIAALNRLNQSFYEQHAEEFAATRSHPWPGWDRVLDRVERELGPHCRPPSILDAGCGSGRFAVYLTERLESRFTYLGLDASRALLDLAADRLPMIEGRRCYLHVDLLDERFHERIVPPPPHPGGQKGVGFCLIAVLGLLHHIPAYERRRGLLAQLASCLHTGGLLVFSAWQFGALPRFCRRVIPWTHHNRTAVSPIDTQQLEAGDHLLAWGNVAVTGAEETGGTVPHPCRYCHFTDPAEVWRLISSLGLELMESFRADGMDDDLNLYCILRKPRSSGACGHAERKLEP